MKVSAAVIDDEPLGRARLKRLLAEQQVDVLAEGETGLDAIRLVKQYEVDLMFIDINMPLMNGLQAVQEIDQFVTGQQDRKSPAIVFCTAYDEYAVQAFKTNAVAYVLKPFSEHDLNAAIRKATHLSRLQITQLQQSQDASATLAVHYDGALQNIDVSNFMY